MTENRVVALRQKGAIDDPLSPKFCEPARASVDRPGGRGGVRDISGLDRGIRASGWPPTGGSPRA